MIPTPGFFQFAFRTVVFSGPGTRSLIPQHFMNLNARRVVLLTDEGLVKAGVVDQILDIFDTIPNGSGIKVVGVYDKIQQDARSKIINDAARFCRERAADSLLAVGGGSVLDTVKAVKYMLYRRALEIGEVMETALTVITDNDVEWMGIPHIAVPTTAGTGAEVSPAGVILNEETHVKGTLYHPFIGADLAFLDPDLTVGLPPRITAFTGMDALTHAVEGFSSNMANPMADSFALQAIRMISQNLRTAVEDGKNIAARGNMLTASTMAIMSFVNAFGAVPVHNCSHAFGGQFNIPHGLANAVLLPIVLKKMFPVYVPKFPAMAEAMGINTHGMSPEEAGHAFIDEVVRLRNDIGLPSNFQEFNIPPARLQDVIIAVLKDPYAVFTQIPPETVFDICQTAVFGG